MLSLISKIKLLLTTTTSKSSQSLLKVIDVAGLVLVLGIASDLVRGDRWHCRIRVIFITLWLSRKWVTDDGIDRCHGRQIHWLILWGHWHTSFWRPNFYRLVSIVTAWRWSSKSLVTSLRWWWTTRIVSWRRLVVLSSTLIKWVLETLSIKIAV